MSGPLKRGEEVYVDSLPPCDLCAGAKPRTATVDGATTLGPWAYMCPGHFATHGRGLGVGRGQRLILRPTPPVE